VWDLQVGNGDEDAVTISRKDVIRESVLHVWHTPILRVLAAGPARYVEIRAGLVQQKGESPGDGYISKELRKLKSLGLVAREEDENAGRPVWSLTDRGRWAVEVLDDFESPSTGTTKADRPAEDHISAATTLLAGNSATVRVDTGPHRRRWHMDEQAPPAVDTTVAHPARRYNYWLGGKDNFAADRESGDELEALFPSVRLMALENRATLKRVVRFLTAEAGVRQFLDIGTGLPTADNTHEIAQAVAPESRILYVDNDPLVLVTARALLTSSDEGLTNYLEADLRDPDTILNSPLLAATLDLSQPVALMLVAVLHFIHGRGAVQPIVKRLMNALPPGSYLVATHATQDFTEPEMAAGYRELLDGGRIDAWPRGREEFTALFNDLELVEPGIVPTSEWRPPPRTPIPNPSDIGLWAGVGRKP
jgi:DNA-binding HxlR family transcriptional regulator